MTALAPTTAIFMETIAMLINAGVRMSFARVEHPHLEHDERERRQTEGRHANAVPIVSGRRHVDVARRTQWWFSTARAGSSQPRPARERPPNIERQRPMSSINAARSPSATARAILGMRTVQQ
ncbi:hypothetical protein GS454_05350 [Rhodococcus hoagii]|nr:hypothetical protein [Prescottella equi]